MATSRRKMITKMRKDYRSSNSSRVTVTEIVLAYVEQEMEAFFADVFLLRIKRHRKNGGSDALILKNKLQFTNSHYVKYYLCLQDIVICAFLHFPRNLILH